MASAPLALSAPPAVDVEGNGVDVEGNGGPEGLSSVLAAAVRSNGAASSSPLNVVLKAHKLLQRRSAANTAVHAAVRQPSKPTPLAHLHPLYRTREPLRIRLQQGPGGWRRLKRSLGELCRTVCVRSCAADSRCCSHEKRSSKTSCSSYSGG